MLFNLNRRKGAQPRSPMDFMPFTEKKRKPKQSVEQMLANWDRAFAQHHS